MKQAPIPQNDEERFDRITRLARHLFDVPIAQVSLVDKDQEWLKSGQGLSITDSSPDISFCGHAVLGSDTLVIPDTLLDERFADTPLVLGQPKIRFYAGHPLTAPDGSHVGMLCVKDHRPRQFGPEDLQALKDLAALVENELTQTDTALELVAAKQHKQVEEDLLKFKLGIEHSNDAVFLTDPNGVIIYINPAFEKVYGFTREEAIGQTPRILKSGLIPPERYEGFWKTLLAKGSVAGEIVNKAKDGRLIYVAANNNPILDAQENIIGFLAVHHDITTQKQAEETLRASEARNRNLLQALPDMIIRYRGDGTYLDIKPSQEFRAFRDPADLMGKNLFDVVPLDVAQKRMQYIQLALQTGQIQTYEHSFSREGQTKFEEIAVVPIEAADEVFVIIRDITERRQAETALRESESRFRSLVEDSPVALWEEDFSAVKRYIDDLCRQGVTDFDAYFNQHPDEVVTYANRVEVIDVNPAAVRLYQAQDKAELIARLSDIFGPESLDTFKAEMRAIARGQTSFEAETLHHTLTGSKINVSIVWSVAPGYEETLSKVIVSMIDITERRQAEETLRQNEALLRTIIDSTPDWIFIKDREHCFQLVNQSFADSVHLTPADLLGKTDLDLGVPEEVVKGNPEKGTRGFWADDLEVMNSGQTKFIAEEPTVIDGQPAFLSTVKSPLRDANGEVWGLLVFVHNITERKQAEETLARRVAELQTVARVSTATSTILETNKLLQEVVDLTKSNFNLYHAHVYLLNQAEDTLMLAAGAGEVGRRMVSAGWSIPLNRERSLVAQAARTRRGLLVNDVRKEPDFLPNPLLPETRAEMAVPLIVGEQLLGVLDVQADVVGRFTEEDLRIQTTLAGQVAVALQNTRSFAEQQKTQQMLQERVKELNCLNEIGREIVESPAVPELLSWTTERIPPAMAYPELCQVAIEYEGQIYGQSQAVELPCQMTHALRIGGEVMGRVYISYTEKREFLNEESALLGGVASRLSGYIESRGLLEQVQDALAVQEHLSIELDSQRRTLQAVLDNIPLGVFVVEAPSGKPLLANEQVKQLLGRGIALDVNKKETAEIYATYRYGTDLLYPPDQTPLARGLLGEITAIDDMEVHQPHGRRVLLQVIGAPIRDAQGSVSASVAIFQDITERKQTEETLKESEERFRVIAETSPVPILISRLSDGLILYSNEQSAQTFGLSVAELIGQQIPDFYYDPADRAVLLATLRRDGRLQDYELHVKKGDGTPFWVLIAMQPLVFAGQSAILTAFYDVTERKGAEEALRRSQEQLSGALETAKLAYWEADMVTMMFTFNDQFYSLLRTTAQQEGGYLMPVMQYAQKFVHPEDAYGVGAEIQKSIETTDPNYSGWAEHRIIRADGSVGYVIVRFRVVKDEQGRTIKTVGANQDITERKQAEEVLRRSQEQLSEALQTAKLAYWEFDVATQTFTFNDQFYALFHTTAEQEGGYLMLALDYARKFVHPDDAYMVGAEIQEALETTEPNYSSQLEHRIIRADGSEGYISVAFRVIKDEQGRTIKTVGANQDITERKQAELERERLLAEVEAAYRRYVRGEWKQLLGEQHQGEMRVEHQAVDHLALNFEPSRLDANLAGLQNEVIAQGKTKVMADAKANGQGTEPAIVTPITVRGQTIGTLGLQDLIPDRQWSTEEVALVETVSEQLALTLENLRLFEDTQKQATREQLTREITDKMRAAPDMDTIIQTGLAELAKALNVSRAYVKLATKPEDD